MSLQDLCNAFATQVAATYSGADKKSMDDAREWVIKFQATKVGRRYGRVAPRSAAR